LQGRDTLRACPGISPFEIQVTFTSSAECISYEEDILNLVEHPHTFWTNPLGKHFATMKASDMVLVDYDGNVVGGNTSRPANAAGFLIHSAVHKARPDVTAACHTHGKAGKAWSTFSRKLDMINQDVTYFYGDAQAVYHEFGGIVFSEEEGKRLAAALGPNGKGLILRNHGLLVSHVADLTRPSETDHHRLWETPSTKLPTSIRSWSARARFNSWSRLLLLTASPRYMLTTKQLHTHSRWAAILRACTASSNRTWITSVSCATAPSSIRALRLPLISKSGLEAASHRPRLRTIK
jgi:hypothetical protein